MILNRISIHLRVIATTALISNVASAREGFSDCGQVPDFLRPCHRATVKIGGNPLGHTGTIVRIDQIDNNTIDVYMLSAWHPFAALPTSEIASHMPLYFQMQTTPTNRIGTSAEHPPWTGMTIVSKDPANDLVLVKSRITRNPIGPNQERIAAERTGGLLGPAEFGDAAFNRRRAYLAATTPARIGNCHDFRVGSAAHAISFPRTEDRRPPESQNVAIPNWRNFCKRWSQGVLTSRTLDGARGRQRLSTNPQPLVGLTVDSVEGSSGAALFDANCGIVGIVSHGVLPPQGDQRPYGPGRNQPRGPERLQTFSPKCDAIRSFMDRAFRLMPSSSNSGTRMKGTQQVD